MKAILYILLFILSTGSFAQITLIPDSNFEQAELFDNTWYLRTVQTDDLAHIYNVSEMDPPINPYLIISEDLNFNGEGACNSFNGMYSLYPPRNMTTIDFTATSDDCGVQEQNDFEDDYFWFISGEFWYDIVQEGDGVVLTLGNPLGGIAVFKSYLLSTKDLYMKELTVYPNPVNDVLVLSSQNEMRNLDIRIFNIEGKLLSTKIQCLKNRFLWMFPIFQTGFIF